MATHDYVIANGTGAAVRSDLNDALAAIVSNNSSSSEPSTRYAYQFWADTTANVLKIRNSANNAWITLRELDGTMLIEDGSASTPGLAFADDVNTGIFSPAADQIGFATSGAERLEIGSSEVVFNDPSNDVDFRVESNGETHMLFVDAGNNVLGIGQSSPERRLHISGGGSSNAVLVESGETQSVIAFEASGSTSNAQVRVGAEANHLIMFAGASEKARVDSSGRLLVGTTTDIADVGTVPLQVVQTGGGGLILARNDTSVSDGNDLGYIKFMGNDTTSNNYTSLGLIQCEADGTHAAGDNPTRLVFSTCADGASSTTERLRISKGGNVGINSTNPQSFGLFVTRSTDTRYTAIEESGKLVARYDDNSGSNFNLLVRNTGITAVGHAASIGFYLGTGGTARNAGVIGAVAENSYSSNAGADSALVFQTATNNTNNEVMRLTNDQYLRMNSGTNGIQFNGDTADDNALDDYERGTWTPAAYENFNGITSPEGQYEKIGNLVTVVFQFNYSSLTNASNDSAISGLPFTVHDFNSLTGVEATNTMFGTNKLVLAYCNSGTDRIYFTTSRPLHGSTSTGADFFRGSISYLAG
jgi:hypothetical protein